MSDLLLRLANDRRTARFIRALGLPAPVRLERAAGGYRPQELAGRSVLLLGTPQGRLFDVARAGLLAAGAEVHAPPADAEEPATMGEGPAATADRPAAGADEPRADPGYHGLVLDASGLRGPADYAWLYRRLQPVLRRLRRNARVVLLGDRPEQQADPAQAAAARGLEGFTRSLAKELGRRGSTANLLLLDADRAALAALSGPLEFFCGARSTFVDGQVLRIGAPAGGLATPAGGERRLAGRLALVTGAARGIGAATAARLAEDGAEVLCLDVAGDREGLYATAESVGGTPFSADIADPATPARLMEFVQRKFGALDIVVHNAGITRDKTLANMKPHLWDQVIAVNFAAIVALDSALLEHQLLRPGGRIVCLSSMGGIAGNYGQTNYAASKAALIGYVAAQAVRLAPLGITANAVAPGFIETRMTAAMPWLPREVGRRLSSLAQGGQARDVAELITFLATPAAAGVNGNTVRVCGQGWLGA